MTTGATIPPVGRRRDEVTPEQDKRLLAANHHRVLAEKAWRETVVAVLAEGASFAEVSKATGLSTNTLQRWKREAGK